MSFAKLDELNRKLEAIEHAQAMLGVDEAVNMPSGGGAKRAEAMGVLAGLYHATATAPHIGEWIGKAESEPLDEHQKAAVSEFRRVFTNMTCLSAAFVERQTAERIRSEQLWRELRPKGDWKGFLPAFKGVIATMREEAGLRAAALKLDPYDALIEQYDPGGGAAFIEPIFATLKRELRAFIPKAMERQKQKSDKRPKKPLNGPYDPAKQKALGEAMMKAIGFDFEHGRLDISHHPFCGGVPSDVRMTTRYAAEDFIPGILGILHETGHGLYEQGLPAQWSHWPSGRARGMAIHESQSLFVEKQIAKSPEFWAWGLPLVREHLGKDALPGWEVEDILAHVHAIKPGFIRVDADEATYPLHIVLRFELEKDLVAGKLAVKDIPEAWDAKMREYLGLSTRDNMRDGPMQDVHWPSGAFGYFPSYTLGALIAAQIMAAMERDMPGVRTDIAAGRFDGITQWRRNRIWQVASRHSIGDIIIKSTGEALNPQYFLNHLERRYLN